MSTTFDPRYWASKIKGTFPFRLGCTSYVFPADILPNVQKLAPVFDDIELVLFESPEVSNIPSPDVVKQLHELGLQHDLSYTIHLPTDHKAGSIHAAERTAFCNGVESIVERLQHIDPYAFVLHLEGIDTHALPHQVSAWSNGVKDTLDTLMAKKIFPDVSKVCVENLAYPFEWHKDILSHYKLSKCLDIGHLWKLEPECWRNQLIDFKNDTHIVHLHGLDGSKDHVSLNRGNSDDIRTFATEYLIDFKNVVTLEVFEEHDTFSSVEFLVNLCQTIN